MANTPIIAHPMLEEVGGLVRVRVEGGDYQPSKKFTQYRPAGCWHPSSFHTFIGAQA